MTKSYQIESQRAVKRLEGMAAEGNPAVQMILPMAEMVGWLRQGVGELVRQAGLQLMSLLMEEEVRQLAGERSQRQTERSANRWGKEQGYCVVMGQKVPLERPRVRSTDDQEVRLGSYEMFHRGEPLTETVWEKLMLGLSNRKYGRAVREFTEAYGLEKSAVSEHFIEASRAKLKELLERRLDKLRFCALVIDATPFEGQQMIVALGIGYDGRKTILGLRQGATENASVVGELLADFELKDSPSFVETKPIARFCMEKFLNREVDKVTVLYSQFINTIDQRPVARTLLPISSFDLPQKTDETGANENVDPLVGYVFEPNAETVLDAMLPYYVQYQVFQMILDARASEHSARMVAMKNATDNAHQFIKDLTLEYNKMRQASITTELLEIATAQMALGG